MKYEYMKESEQMLQYFQFPKFLLKLRISQTAKFLYMILYDRARISRKNSWIDKYGNVYLIFPIDELSVQIGKCKSSVKTALKELDDVGLLVRRSGGFSKPNHLYVKIPSDEIGLQTVDDKAVEKMAAIESEKQPSSGRKNGCAGVGNVAPSKVTEKYKRNKYHEVNYCYGEGEEFVMREEDTVCVGSDGLQYCKVCGEAKEAFFPEGGFMGMKKHSRQCACDRKAYEEEQKYFKDKEHRELVSRNTSICFDESRMEEWTFENADMSDAVMHKAKNYVDNWDEMKRNHIGCLFWGPVGTGKSYIAGCIANELLKQEVTVKMTNFNTIIDDIFPLADKTEYINALASYQLLIIDDLGVERNSEYALGIIFSVIDRRIRSGRPLIITTNLPLKEIKSETMLDKRRIYDRILEMCTPMYVGGTSKREAIASMKMEKAKTLLNTNRGEEECE